VVKSLGDSVGKITEVELLGHGKKLEWEQTSEGLSVDLPAKPPTEFALTLKVDGLKLNGQPNEE
jgi:hypothetical protein